MGMALGLMAFECPAWLWKGKGVTHEMMFFVIPTSALLEVGRYHGGKIADEEGRVENASIKMR